MTITFDLPAAQNALARSDEGVDPLPGDAELIAAYESYCQQEQDRFEEKCREAEYARWLADQCGGCEEGGAGEQCDDHRPTTCTTCGYKTWDALDLEPGDSVCVCDEPFSALGDAG